MGHGDSNKESDECYTPYYAIKPLLKYIAKELIVWCPFDKENSEYVKTLKSNGNKVIFSHIEDGKDFFRYKPKKYDIIISNPPFSLADEVLERLYILGKPFILLLPLKYLQAIGRGKLFIKNGIQLLTFDKRIGYYTNGDMTEPKEGNYQASSYFCWKILPKDLIYEILDKSGKTKKEIYTKRKDK